MKNLACFSLSLQERDLAHELWESLVFGSTPEAENARLQLCEAPDAIQRAIIHEIVQTLRQGLEFQDRANPFSV